MRKGCEECDVNREHPAFKVANAIAGPVQPSSNKAGNRIGGPQPVGAGVTPRPPPEIRILRDECIPGLAIRESVVPGRMELRTLDEVVFADSAKKVWPQQPKAAVNAYGRRPPGLIAGVQISQGAKPNWGASDPSAPSVANRAAPSVAAPLRSMDWVLREDDDVSCDSASDGEYIPVNGPRHDYREGTPRSDSRRIRAKQEREGWDCMLTSGLLPNLSMAPAAVVLPPDDDAPDDEPDDPAGSGDEYRAIEV